MNIIKKSAWKSWLKSWRGVSVTCGASGIKLTFDISLWNITGCITIMPWLMNFKECHPRCVGKLDRWEGSQKHNSYDI